MSWEVLNLLRQLPAHRRKLAQGRYLFRRGDPVTVLHVVRRGHIRLIREQADGASLVLQQAGAGAVLAEASLFAGHYHCAGVAGVDSEVDAIAVEAVREKLRSEPVMAEAWAAYLAAEVQRARFRSEVLSLKTVSERLDAWLSWAGDELPPKGQWNLLAQQIGVSPEALYRELARRRHE